MKYAIRDSQNKIIGYALWPSASTDQSPIDEQSADWLAYLNPPPTAADVEAERDRRLAANAFEYDFGDARGVHVIGTDEKDMAAWIGEVMPTAGARVNLGVAATIDIVTNTGPATITPMEWMAIIDAGSPSRQAIWAAYFALIAKDPIPANYADDQHWT